MFMKRLVPLSNWRNELHIYRTRSWICNRPLVTTDETWVNFIMVQEWQTSRKNILKKVGVSPFFCSNRILFQTPIKNILVERILYVKTFLLKKWLNSSIIHLIIFIASERHLVAVLQEVTKKPICLPGVYKFWKKLMIVI